MATRLLLWTLFQWQVHSAAVQIDVSPSGQKFAVGDQAVVQCSLQGSTSSDSLFWYRRQGDISFKLGTDDLLTLNDGNVGDGRYSLTPVQIGNNSRVYKLTVTNVQLEDSATIECRLSTDLSVLAPASAAVIVCTDASSSFCDCTRNEGWASPKCFDGQLDESVVESARSGHQTVISLIIAFVVVVAYSVLLFLLGKRETLLGWCKKEKEREEEEMLNGKPDREIESLQGQLQTEPSDSASDSATSDPSSSSGFDSHGSTQSAASSERFVPGSPEVQENWTMRKKRPRQETTFILKPEVHYNEGYVGVDDGKVKTPDGPEEFHLPPPADVPGAPLSGRGAVGGLVDDSFCEPEPHPAKSRAISTVSGSCDARHRQSLGSLFPAQSLLSIAGTEI